MVYCIALVVLVIVVVVKTFHFSVFRPREAAQPENGKMKCFQYYNYY